MYRKQEASVDSTTSECMLHTSLQRKTYPKTYCAMPLIAPARVSVNDGSSLMAMALSASLASASVLLCASVRGMSKSLRNASTPAYVAWTHCTFLSTCCLSRGSFFAPFSSNGAAWCASASNIVASVSARSCSGVRSHCVSTSSSSSSFWFDVGSFVTVGNLGSGISTSSSVPARSRSDAGDSVASSRRCTASTRPVLNEMTGIRSTAGAGESESEDEGVMSVGAGAAQELDVVVDLRQLFC